VILRRRVRIVPAVGFLSENRPLAAAAAARLDAELLDQDSIAFWWYAAPRPESGRHSASMYWPATVHAPDAARWTLKAHPRARDGARRPDPPPAPPTSQAGLFRLGNVRLGESLERNPRAASAAPRAAAPRRPFSASERSAGVEALRSKARQLR
jgi:hypothetical protein